MSFRILVVDDHAVVRPGLRALLKMRGRYAVCGEASNGQEAIARAKQLKPDLIIMDVSMPEMDGLEATRQVLRILPQTQVLILTMHESEQMLRKVAGAGARGCVLKSDVSRELIEAIETLRRRRPFFSWKASEVLLGNLTQEESTGVTEDDAPKPHLTPRELQVLQLIAAGKNSKNIAAALGIRVRTAETHRTNIMRKFHVHSTGQLVSYAIRYKLLEP